MLRARLRSEGISLRPATLVFLQLRMPEEFVAVWHQLSHCLAIWRLILDVHQLTFEFLDTAPAPSLLGVAPDFNLVASFEDIISLVVCGTCWRRNSMSQVFVALGHLLDHGRTVRTRVLHTQFSTAFDLLDTAGGPSLVRIAPNLDLITNLVLGSRGGLWWWCSWHPGAGALGARCRVEMRRRGRRRRCGHGMRSRG